MENTYNKKVPKTPGDGARKAIPPSRPLEQTEPVGQYGNASQTANEGRLQTSVSVGKKGSTKTAAPHEVESFRPAPEEMTNG